MISRQNNTSYRVAKIAGFTLFEAAVVGVLLAILSTVLLHRVFLYQGQAERAKAEQVVGILRTALQIRLAEIQVGTDTAALEILVAQNPMDWLRQKPPNYLGEYYDPKLESLQKGNWFYDRRHRLLVYLLNDRKSFASSAPNLLKFKVKFNRLPSNPAKPDGPPLITGVVLDQVFDRESLE